MIIKKIKKHYLIYINYCLHLKKLKIVNGKTSNFIVNYWSPSRDKCQSSTNIIEHESTNYFLSMDKTNLKDTHDNILHQRRKGSICHTHGETVPRTL